MPAQTDTPQLHSCSTTPLHSQHSTIRPYTAPAEARCYCCPVRLVFQEVADVCWWEAAAVQERGYLQHTGAQGRQQLLLAG